MILSFDAYEMQRLVMVAHSRNVVKEVHKVRNQRYDKNQSDFSMHLHGIMGEYAVAKFLNIKIDKNIALAGDDKISDLIKNKKRIQVKTTLRDNKVLFFNSKLLFRADLAVLTSIRSATDVGLEGWISREEFLNKATTFDFGYGERWGIVSQKLNNIDKIKDFVENNKEVLV
jgi:aromatic ring-opening dioxygenase LigB subunit